MRHRSVVLASRSSLVFVAWIAAASAFGQGAPLDGTAELSLEGDIASRLVDGVDRFLLRELARSPGRREAAWLDDFSATSERSAALARRRGHLAHILGVRDGRVPFSALELMATTEQPALVGHGDGYRIYAVRWPVFGEVHGEGLLVEPTLDVHANVIVLPDADISPEQLVGLAEGVPPASRFALRLAASGCRVVVPALVDRGVIHRRLSNREYLYRSAFELGRHIVGYEAQKALALVDLYRSSQPKRPLGVIGHGEGGVIALWTAALDDRVDAVCASGAFDERESVWEEPVYRNVFGLLEAFGDAEVAAMITPRPVVIEAARGPELVVPPGTGGAPGRLRTPPIDAVRREVTRARRLAASLGEPRIELVESGDGSGLPGAEAALTAFLSALAPKAKLAPTRGDAPTSSRPNFDPAARQRRQIDELDRHNQWLLRESAYVRRQLFATVDTSSIEAFERTIEPFRTRFRDEVIGRIDYGLLPARPRSRQVFDTETLEGWQVVLDVFPDVIAYGILLVPKGIEPGERRPVVVCQHGLEGRPRDVADPSIDHPAYHRYAVRLAERGFVTFAPQNLYIFQDRFRTLQRKANPVGKTLFSVIVPQHQQIVRWLGSLDFVDPDRIAFYGLSYGGKTAMRVPPLVEEYCLSICSADFNEWVWKNASTRSPYSYVWTGEYEIFEFDLGSTFNYAEMAALIAPRPFMVERGHFDGVAPDETVAYEFAKVRHLYQAKLGIGERCEIEWFVGPHTIHGEGTFRFLHRWLRWPERE